MLMMIVVICNGKIADGESVRSMNS
jgi:hypothetical protein